MMHGSKPLHTAEELLAWQKQLEEQAYARGVRRFNKRVDAATEAGNASTVGAAPSLLSRAITPLSTAISYLCGEKRPGPRNESEHWLNLVGHDVAAYLALKVVLDGIGSDDQAERNIALNIADLIQDELRYRRFKEQAPHLFNYKLTHFRTSNYAHKARSMDASMKIAQIDVADITMNQNERFHVGQNLIDLLIQSTGLVRRETLLFPGRGRTGVQKESFLRPEPETTQLLTDANKRREDWWPVLMPMVVQPLPWVLGGWSEETGVIPATRGGYRFRQRSGYPMVTQRMRLGAEIRPQQQVPQMVHDAVNRLQETPFAVNARVLEVIETIVANGGGIAGIPHSSDLPDPQQPHDIATNDAAKKAWSKLKAGIISQNVVNRSERVRLQKTRVAAATLSKAPAIYFPFHLDSRGRAYPIAQGGLSPQGDDTTRGLLLFATGRDITKDDRAIKWLAVHGANCRGAADDGTKMSTMTLSARQKWVYDNTPAIQQAADNPTVGGWWTEADDPWQFLAFCFEWCDLVRANAAEREYVCRLPVSIDGSANALQLWACLLGDVAGAEASNVIPNADDAPRDPYSQMAEDTLTRLVDVANTGNEIAMLWLGLDRMEKVLTRKLLKVPVMTFTYSATEVGLKARLQEHFQSLPIYQKIYAHFATVNADGTVGSRMGKAYQVLASVIWDTLEDKVKAAADGMAWLTKAVRGITDQNKSPHWTVPVTGLVVEQRYFLQEMKQVKTAVAGGAKKGAPKTRRDHIYSVDRTKVATLRHGRSAPANFIHSLDAAVMMKTALFAAAEQSDIQLSMVHDSFATIPSDCELLSRNCRQAVTLIFQQDVLGNLYRELASQWKCPEECPEPPQKGPLDVAYILASAYAYA